MWWFFNEMLDKTSHFDLVCAIWTWLEHERHSDLLVFFLEVYASLLVIHHNGYWSRHLR